MRVTRPTRPSLFNPRIDVFFFRAAGAKQQTLAREGQMMFISPFLFARAPDPFRALVSDAPFSALLPNAIVDADAEAFRTSHAPMCETLTVG
jgi:hypothetical protein